MTDPTPAEGTEQPTAADQLRAAFPAPEDIDEAHATGWAVFDHQLARYVGGVTADKPTAKQAREVAGDHPTTTVRV